MLRIFKVENDFVSRCPMDNTSCQAVFVHPDFDFLCIVLKSISFVISWDKCSGNLSEDEILKQLQKDAQTTFIRRIE